MPPAAARHRARSSDVPSRRSSLRPGTVPDQPGRVVRLEYTFDRLFGTKLELAYAALVANVTRRRGEPAHPTGGLEDENSGDLRPGFRRPAEAGADDREPDGGADRVRRDQRLQRAGRVGHRG